MAGKTTELLRLNGHQLNALLKQEAASERELDWGDEEQVLNGTDSRWAHRMPPPQWTGRPPGHGQFGVHRRGPNSRDW